MYHIFFIHLSVDGYVGGFHLLAILSSASLNVGVHVSLGISVSDFLCVYIPRSGIAESHGSSSIILDFGLRRGLGRKK